MTKWMQTLKGQAFTILDPTPKLIDFDEIAEALAKTCRFNGHCQGFYSVAQHSVLVVDIIQHLTDFSPYNEMGRQALLYALLHDAHEAYVNDIITPVKEALFEAQKQALKELSDELGTVSYLIVCEALEKCLGIDKIFDRVIRPIDAALFTAAGLEPEMPAHIREVVKLADLTALMTERRDLLADGPEWGCNLEPFPRQIKPQPWTAAHASFVTRLRELTEWDTNSFGIAHRM